MNQSKIRKLNMILKRFHQLAAVVDELAQESAASKHLTDHVRASQSKIVNKGYRDIISDLEEVVAELNEPSYMVEDIDFYEKGDVESA